MKALGFAILRGLNAAYFVVSSLYCVLSYSSFAYAQFIRPQLVGWLPDLIAVHHQAFWLTLVFTAPTLVAVIRSAGMRRRAAAAIYLGTQVALGLWLVTNPVLAMAGPNTRTLVLAILWLVPPFALAIVDHITTTPPSFGRIGDRRECSPASTAIDRDLAVTSHCSPGTSLVPLASSCRGRRLRLRRAFRSPSTCWRSL